MSPGAPFARLLSLCLLVALGAPLGASLPVFQLDRPHPTADKPQSKLWYVDATWWALLPGSRSPTLWQRGPSGWEEHPSLRDELDGLPGRADVWWDREGVTAACVEDATIAVLRLRSVGQPVTAWKPEVLARWTVPDTGALETVTIARDSTGRWWIAAPVDASVPAGSKPPFHGPDRDVLVWTSVDARTWQRLDPLARRVGGDDICTVTATADGIGVAWSDQNRDQVGFARHRSGADPATWEPTETIAAGNRTSDDHLHATLTADGTVWLATKNSVDLRGEPQLVLRVRPPSGHWQNLPYAPRREGAEPSRPVIVATPDSDLLLLGHTVYDRVDPSRGHIEFAPVNRSGPQEPTAFTRVLIPDAGLDSRINDLTTPKQPFPTDGPWIVLASDAQGRVFEADLRPVFATVPVDTASRAADLAGPFRATAAQPPRLHRGEIMRSLEPLMLQQARHLVSELQPWNNEPGAALLPLLRRAPSSESGIRPNAHTAKGLALIARLLPPEAFPAGFSAAKARKHALELVRTLVRTYGAGGETCSDGKPWRAQWQSAYWAALAGEACWLLWHDLSPDERWLAARMICDEADRFVGVVPPTNLHRDSKAEENAWNSQVVSLAYSMFPSHPRHALWRETALRWIASAFAREADLKRTDRVDGKPLHEWLDGANLLDDFTLENHGRVHPDYLACTYLLSSQVPLYTWGGHEPPEALHLNVEAIHGTLKWLSTPEGSVIYPNGQDWGLHRNIDWLEYHATLAVLYQDRTAALLMRQALDTVQRMAARNPDGPVYLPGETKLVSDQAMVLEYAAHTYALMAERGEGPAPVGESEFLSAQAGTRIFPQGKFAVIRTPHSIATFSWGAQVMGMVLPLRRDLLMTPESRGLIGYVGPDRTSPELPELRNVAIAPLEAGFGLTGVLARGGGTFEQRFGFLALPDGRGVYVDVVSATGSTRPGVLDLGTLGVLNDLAWPWHGGQRTLAHAGGTRVFAAAQAAGEEPASFDSPWFQIDGLGIVRLAASGPARYIPAPTSAAGRLEQRFHLNSTATARLTSTPSGQPLAFGVYVFYPGASPSETAAFAARSRLESPPGALQPRLRLDDGTIVHMDLSALTLTVSAPSRVSSR